MPPDAVPPTGRGLTEATALRERDQFNSVAIDRDDSEHQLPTHRGAHPPRFGVERRTVRWVGHPDEGRKLPVHATHGGHRRPDL